MSLVKVNACFSCYHTPNLVWINSFNFYLSVYRIPSASSHFSWIWLSWPLKLQSSNCPEDFIHTHTHDFKGGEKQAEVKKQFPFKIVRICLWLSVKSRKQNNPVCAIILTYNAGLLFHKSFSTHQTGIINFGSKLSLKPCVILHLN